MWTTQPAVCAERNSQPGSGRTSLSVTSSELYACNCDGVLRAHSLLDGQTVAEFGLGRCSPIVASGHRVATDLWFPDTTANVYSTGYAAGVIDFDVLAPAVSTWIHGRAVMDGKSGLRCPCQVRVGSALVRTDADGQFRAQVVGRGVLSAEVVVARPPANVISRTMMIQLQPGKPDQEVMLSTEVQHMRPEHRPIPFKKKPGG